MSECSVKTYPSSSHQSKDWDKLVSEINEEEKNEKPEGDAALNSLFQKIYGDGSDEVKKAMNKSYVSYCFPLYNRCRNFSFFSEFSHFVSG